MKLQIHRHRLCITGCPEEMTTGLDRIKAAYKAGILPEGQKVFSGEYSTFFAVLKKDVLRTYNYRDNWNGYHDVAAYSLPSFEPIGTKVMADYTIGQHRNIVNI